METETELVELIVSFRERLPIECVDEYVDLARHNEPMIAFENLCVQLFEFDVCPDERELKALKSLGGKLGCNEDYWTFLEND